jgi:hypothetical protein
MSNLRLIKPDHFSGESLNKNECLNSLSQDANAPNIPIEVISIDQYRDRLKGNLPPDDDPKPPCPQALAA